MEFSAYESIWDIKLRATADKLRSNHMDAYIAKSPEELMTTLDKLVPFGGTVNAGGSMTLEHTGVIDYLRDRSLKGDFIFYDRAAPDVNTPDQIEKINLQAFEADHYFTSANAITADGWLYNVDGTGNRVAALMYGPKNVIVICGRNKWVKSLDEAIERNRQISAPMNCVRLNKKTPCIGHGECQDCNAQDRICNMFTLIKNQSKKGRIKVILLYYGAGY